MRAPGTSSCTALCRIDRCGNGVVDPGEACEAPGSPGCGALCQVESCGDGLLDLTALEECEPPGTAICDARCQSIHTCGDGVIEPGEECDGQPQCAADCTLPRALCCDLVEVCIGRSVNADIDQYFFAKNCATTLGGGATFGTCEGIDACDPPAPPEFGCRVGSCGDRPIEPLPLCCQQAAGGCRDTVAATAGALGTFGCGNFPPFTPGEVNRILVGTCGDDGRCVPAN